MKPEPYIPRPWQLPHMLSTPPGGTVLIVERASIQPPQLSGGFEWEITPSGKWFECVAVRHHEEGVDHPSAREEHLWERLGCPLGPVGTVLSIEGVGDFRTTGIDLRKVDMMTKQEAALWGCPKQEFTYPWDPELKRSVAVSTKMHPLVEARLNWEAHYDGKWGDWAWLITAERTDRC